MRKWQQVEMGFNDNNDITDGDSTVIGDGHNEDNLIITFSSPLQLYGLILPDIKHSSEVISK